MKKGKNKTVFDSFYDLWILRLVTYMYNIHNLQMLFCAKF